MVQIHQQQQVNQQQVNQQQIPPQLLQNPRKQQKLLWSPIKPVSSKKQKQQQQQQQQQQQLILNDNLNLLSKKINKDNE